jgi:hypothetical protein
VSIPKVVHRAIQNRLAPFAALITRDAFSITMRSLAGVPRNVSALAYGWGSGFVALTSSLVTMEKSKSDLFLKRTIQTLSRCKWHEADANTCISEFADELGYSCIQMELVLCKIETVFLLRYRRGQRKYYSIAAA